MLVGYSCLLDKNITKPNAENIALNVKQKHKETTKRSALKTIVGKKFMDILFLLTLTNK